LGGNTTRSVNSSFQPHLYTSYERDPDGGDEAMMRRYLSTSMRFVQPDPYDGSYEPANPQLFNRYSYVNNESRELCRCDRAIHLARK
jgi:RHS repeat-associated protein